MCRGAWHEPSPHHRNRPIAVRMEVPHVLEEETDDNRKESCRESGEREALAWARHSPGARADSRLLLPVAVLVLQAAGEYVNRFLYASPDVTPLSERSAHTLARLKMVEDAHEAWLAKHG